MFFFDKIFAILAMQEIVIEHQLDLLGEEETGGAFLYVLGKKAKEKKEKMN